MSKESLFGEKVHPDCLEAVEETARLCAELGHTVEEATPAFDQTELIRAFFVIVAVGTASAIEDAARLVGRSPTPDQFELIAWTLGLIGRKRSAADLDAAIAATRQAGRRLGRFFEHYDVLCNATLAMPPLEIGALQPTDVQRAMLRLALWLPLGPLLPALFERSGAEWLEPAPNTMLFNMTGQPAMSVPLHWNPAGLPIGVQFVGRFGDEATLFRLASQLEVAKPWAGRRPPLLAGKS